MKCWILIAAVVSLSHGPASANELSWQDAEEGVFAVIGEFTDDIVFYSDAFGVDPHLVAAILYVEKIQYVLDDWLRIRNHLESAAAEYFFFIRDLLFWADLSTGYCRIKPSFAQETYLRLLSDPGAPPLLSEDDVDPSLYLERPSLSIKVMCAGLYVLQQEWAVAGIDISGSPEILATLYNIGYENSEPKQSPSPGGSEFPVIVNGTFIRDMNFGERVMLVIDESALLAQLFDDDSL